MFNIFQKITPDASHVHSYYRKPEQLMRSLGVGEPIPMERWDDKTQQIRDLDDKLEIMRALREREDRIRAEHV